MNDTPVDPRELELPRDLNRAVELLFDRKATDVVLVDLKGISSATDAFLIATGRSDTHVASIAQNVVDGLRAEGFRALNVEGLRTARWVLIDYFDFVVHVFHPEAREFYQLERLWGDAPTHHLEALESSTPGS
jgi:ribosome-associated protein